MVVNLINDFPLLDARNSSFIASISPVINQNVSVTSKRIVEHFIYIFLTFFFGLQLLMFIRKLQR